MDSTSRQQPSQTNHGVELAIAPTFRVPDDEGDDETRELLLDVGGLLLAGREAAGPAAAPPKIRVRELRRQAAGGHEILRGVDLDVPRGVVMGVIGPSGSGKSTLLRALNRLWEPAPGAVLLDGADICGLDVRALRRRVGMLFQQPAMFDGTSRTPASTLVPSA
jgi:ABC-type multidrug transport system fused ATPase/permease subunit